MNNSVNTRVLMLKTQLRLTDVAFCQKVDISTGTLHRVKNGDSISPKTLRLIAENTGISEKWLIDGVGELDVSELISSENVSVNWKDEAYTRLQEEVLFLRNLVNKMAGNAAANFPNAFDLVGFSNFEKAVESVSLAA